MPTYLITNRQPDAYRGSPDAMQAWTTWFDQLGEQLVERGNPVFTRTTVGDCGPTTRLGGYTLITADDLEHATNVAANCPAIGIGGGIEVGELTILNWPDTAPSTQR